MIVVSTSLFSQTPFTVNLVNKIDVAKHGETTGLITVKGIGGSGHYLYSWNTTPIQTTATITNLKAGVYTVTVIDESGCRAPFIANVIITEPPIFNYARYDTILLNNDIVFYIDRKNIDVTYVTQGKDTMFVQNDDLGHLFKNIWDTTTTSYTGKKPIIVEVSDIQDLIARRNKNMRYAKTYKSQN